MKCDEAIGEHHFHHHHHHRHRSNSNGHGHGHHNPNNNKNQLCKLFVSSNENSTSSILKRKDTNKFDLSNEVDSEDNNDECSVIDKIFIDKSKMNKDDGNYEGNVPHADGVQPLSANVFSVGAPQLNDTMEQ